MNVLAFKFTSILDLLGAYSYLDIIFR